MAVCFWNLFSALVLLDQADILLRDEEAKRSHKTVSNCGVVWKHQSVVDIILAKGMSNIDVFCSDPLTCQISIWFYVGNTFPLPKHWCLNSFNPSTYFSRAQIIWRRTSMTTSRFIWSHGSIWQPFVRGRPWDCSNWGPNITSATILGRKSPEQS